MKRVILSHIALLLANTIYALNYIFAKDVMPEYIKPAGFILFRIIGGATIFLIIHNLFIKETVSKKDFFYIILCALFGVVINMLCFFKGLSLTTPINASLIMITTPLIVYLISVFFSRKNYKHIQLVGVFFGLIGAVALITDGSFSFRINYLGDFLIFLNATSYGLYLILIKSMMQKYHPITVLKNLFLIGFLIVLPIGLPEFLEINFNSMPVDIIFKALFVILFTTCLAYFLNIYAISKLEASTVAFYIYLQPLLATAFSILWGKDNVTVIKLMSGFLIFLGVYFVIKRK